MANKNRSEKTILVAGKRYKLKLTISALAEFEEDIDMVIDQWVMDYVKENKHSLKQLLKLFHRSLQAGMRDDSIEYATATDIAEEYASKNGGAAVVSRICFDLIEIAFNGEGDGEGKA